MSGRPLPYRYLCTECGDEDVADNQRGPLRSRCRECMWGRSVRYRLQTAATTNPFRSQTPEKPRPCEGCGAKLPPPGSGRPRRFCTVCRPSKSTPPASIAKAKAERQAWKGEHPMAPRPLLRQAKQTRAELIAINRAASPCHSDHACEHCGDLFRPKRTDRLRFCSRKCAAVAREAAKRTQNG